MMAHKKLERAVQEADARARRLFRTQAVWMTKDDRFMCWSNHVAPAAPGHLLVATVGLLQNTKDGETYYTTVVEYKI